MEVEGGGWRVDGWSEGILEVDTTWNSIPWAKRGYEFNFHKVSRQNEGPNSTFKSFPPTRVERRSSQRTAEVYDEQTNSILFE